MRKQRVTIYVDPTLVKFAKHGAVDKEISLSEYMQKLIEEKKKEGGNRG